MRAIGIFPQEEQAQTFSDYLLTRGIRSKVEADGDDWELWVFDEDQLDQARAELTTFRENPDDERYREAAGAARTIRARTEKREKEIQKKYVDMRDRWDGPLHRRMPITFALILASILIGVSGELGGRAGAPLPEVYVRFQISKTPPQHLARGKRVPPNLTEVRSQGEIWRLVTPIFLHFDLLHIIFNLYMLHFFGTVLENRFRRLVYVGMILFIAVTSNLAQYYFSGHGFGGMSGVNYGLFGYCWMKTVAAPQDGIVLPPNIILILMGWFILCVANVIPNVANAAHAVGLMAGLMLGYVFTALRFPRS